MFATVLIIILCELPSVLKVRIGLFTCVMAPICYTSVTLKNIHKQYKAPAVLT